MEELDKIKIRYKSFLPCQNLLMKTKLLGLLTPELYLTPSEMFVEDFASKGFSFFNAWCQLRLGYSRTFLNARVTKIEIVNGKDTDLHIDKPVYAIHLANVREEYK